MASASGEIPHVVGDAGVVLPESDRAAWAATIAQLAGDAGRRAELAARGRRRAEAQFAWPIIARQHTEFFESVIGQRRAA